MRTIWLLAALAACGTKHEKAPAAGSGSTVAPTTAASSGSGAAPIAADEPTWFEYAHEFSEGVAAVSTRGKWGFIDKTGRFVLAPTYSYALPFTEGHAWVYDDHDVAFIIDRAGTRSAPLPQVMHGDKPFERGYAVVFWRTEYGNTTAIVDTNGKLLIDPSRLHTIWKVYGTDLWKGRIDDQECVFDRTGTCVADFPFEVRHGKLRVKRDDKQGIVDLQGVVKIPITHRELRFAEDGRVWTRRKDNRWQALDDEGKPLDIPTVDQLPDLSGERIWFDRDLGDVPPVLRDRLTARYPVVHRPREDMIRVERKDQHTGFFSITGQPLVVK